MAKDWIVGEIVEKRTKYLLIFIVFLSLICVVTSSYSYARYVSNQVWNYYLGTKGFYFSSNQLGVSKVTNVNSNWDYGKTWFTIKNSENNFLISDFDIEYNVKCTIQNDVSTHSKCIINGTDSDTFKGTISYLNVCKSNIDGIDASLYNKEQCEENGYEWKVEETFKDLYFEVINTDDKSLDYVSVLIEVTSTSPYQKTLLGEFNLSGGELSENGIKLDYKEFNNYSRVIISNSYDENKCVKLSWNSSNLKIDESSEKVSTYQYDDNNSINEIELKINKRESISYLFYRTDFTKNYSNENFNLVESKGC